MFYGCSNIETIILPSTITLTELDMFRGCYNLTSLFIPNGATRLTRSSFSSLLNPFVVTFPNNLTIYSPRGSHSHNFALQNEINWQEWGASIPTTLPALTASELETAEPQPSEQSITPLSIPPEPGRLQIASRPYRTIYVAGEFLDRYGLEVDFIEPRVDAFEPIIRRRLAPSKYSLDIENRPLMVSDLGVRLSYDDFYEDAWENEWWPDYTYWDTFYGIRVLSPTVGDLNNDRKIDTNDAMILIDKANFNIPLTNADNPLSDLNNDGFVDIDDLTLMLDSWNFNRAVRAPE